MDRKALKEGWEGCIEFWDHAEASGVDYGAIPSKVWGKVVKVTQRDYEVVVWECGNNPEHPDNNIFSIVRSCVYKTTEWK